jgi:hypothetical protein
MDLPVLLRWEQEQHQMLHHEVTTSQQATQRPVQLQQLLPGLQAAVAALLGCN